MVANSSIAVKEIDDIESIDQKQENVIRLIIHHHLIENVIKE